MSTTKPYHLMTPAERLTHRIEQNRIIDEKVKQPIPRKEPSGTGLRTEVTDSFSIRKMGRG